MAGQPTRAYADDGPATQAQNRYGSSRSAASHYAVFVSPYSGFSAIARTAFASK